MYGFLICKLGPTHSPTPQFAQMREENMYTLVDRMIGLSSLGLTNRLLCYLQYLRKLKFLRLKLTKI